MDTILQTPDPDPDKRRTTKDNSKYIPGVSHQGFLLCPTKSDNLMFGSGLFACLAVRAKVLLTDPPMSKN